VRPQMITAGLICGLVVSGSTPDAAAQIGYLWTYDELLQKAHVVVIARCLATLDTGTTASHPELSSALPSVEMHTKFRLEAILKTSSQHPAGPGTEFRLRHFRLDMERWRREHPPEPGMPPPGLVGGISALALLEGRSYLLFLTKRADGLYEPLSGFTFPADSVILLDKPSVLDRPSAISP
jgi:hypothetical protein